MPKSNGFTVVPDIYKRGNGRWAKVTRQHVKVGERLVCGVPENLWKHHYSLCFGQDGIFTAFSHDVFHTKKTALFFADCYIKDGTTTV